MDISSATPWSIWFYIFSSSWPASDHCIAYHLNHFQCQFWGLCHTCPPFLERLNGVRLLALWVCTTPGVKWRDWAIETLYEGKCFTLFPLFLPFYDKSGESDKNRESGRPHIKSRDSWSHWERWNLCRHDPWKMETERESQALVGQ